MGNSFLTPNTFLEAVFIQQEEACQSVPRPNEQSQSFPSRLTNKQTNKVFELFLKDLDLQMNIQITLKSEMKTNCFVQ